MTHALGEKYRMIEFKNKSRTEAILENMLGATNTLKPPQSRVEALLMELLELIEDISHGSGTVFRFLGEKEYVDDLPETGNEQGDVWFVKEKMAGFIWIVREDYPNGYWEELGEVIDTASLENVFFPVQYNVTPYSDILGAIQSNKVPVLILHPGTGALRTRYAYFGYYDFTGAYFYEFSPDDGIIEYLIKTKQGWQSPRTINLVNSVNGQTGTVVLTAADFDIYRVIYTVDFDTNAATCNKTASEIFTAMQSTKAVEAALVDADSGYTIGHLSSVLFGGTTLIWSAQSYSNNLESYLLFHTISNNNISIMSTGSVNSVSGKTGVVVLDADDVGAQAPFMTATFTIAVSDWDLVSGSYVHSVPGMTSGALVFVKYSDTETEFTERQGTNSMTFTAATIPSEAVTVHVAWFKGAASA